MDIFTYHIFLNFKQHSVVDFEMSDYRFETLLFFCISVKLTLNQLLEQPVYFNWA